MCNTEFGIAAVTGNASTNNVRRAHVSTVIAMVRVFTDLRFLYYVNGDILSGFLKPQKHLPHGQEQQWPIMYEKHTQLGRYKYNLTQWGFTVSFGTKYAPISKRIQLYY